MSRRECFPEDSEFEHAQTFLADVYPDALAIMLVDLEGDEAIRMKKAGFGLVEIILPNIGTYDGTCVEEATFITRITPHTVAIEAIWLDEENGTLPPGSHNSAMDSIRYGEFGLQWGSYLPD